jgi:hypothetical protein
LSRVPDSIRTDELGSLLSPDSLYLY